MPNKSLLRKTLNTIKKNPTHWNQSAWKCGTSFCFAGWAVKLNGGRFFKQNDSVVFARKDDPEEHVYESKINGRVYKVVRIEDRAMRILKLDYWTTGDDLFCCDNTLVDLEQKVKILTATK